jgi:hypothetical protein
MSAWLYACMTDRLTYLQLKPSRVYESIGAARIIATIINEATRVIRGLQVESIYPIHTAKHNNEKAVQLHPVAKEKKRKK